MRLHILVCLAWLTIGDESGQIDDVSCGLIREWVDEQMEGTSGATLTMELGAKAIKLQAKALGTGYICQARLFADDPTLPGGLLCPPGLQCFGTPSQLRGTSLCAICLDSTFAHPTLTAPCSDENTRICEQLRADPRLVNNGTCLPCMPGTLCPRGSVNLVGLAASNLCPRGSYCPDPLTLLSCPVGHWCGEGALFPIPCEGTPGHFCANGYMRYCHKGSYCPSSSEELLCPEGHFCPAAVSTPIPCRYGEICRSQGRYAPSTWLRDISVLLFYLACAVALRYAGIRASNRRQGDGRTARLRDIRQMHLLDLIHSHVSDGKVEGASALTSQTKGLKRRANTGTITFENVVVQYAGMSAPVLNHVSGELPSAALTALMGPSGCGKSTLMGAVCGRVPAKNVSGRISFGDSIQRVGFVAQDDVLHRSLTVLENLYFSAHMRLPADTPNDVMREVVADVIKFLALFNVESREIGDAENKVLSGGQIRRVSIGMEMVADPDVLFLDEPTSGLDASAALEVVQGLAKLSQMGRTVVAVIHQPRAAVFDLFDHVVLLGSKGRVVYCGPRTACLPYWSTLGFVPPPRTNPSDFLLDILQGTVLPRKQAKAAGKSPVKGRAHKGGERGSLALSALSEGRESEVEGAQDSVTTVDSDQIMCLPLDEQWEIFQDETATRVSLRRLDDEVFRTTPAKKALAATDFPVLTRALLVLADGAEVGSGARTVLRLNMPDELDYQAFLRLCMDVLGEEEAMPEADIRDLFKELDLDGGGTISAEELKESVKAVMEHVVFEAEAGTSDFSKKSMRQSVRQSLRTSFASASFGPRASRASFGTRTSFPVNRRPSPLRTHASLPGPVNVTTRILSDGVGSPRGSTNFPPAGSPRGSLQFPIAECQGEDTDEDENGTPSTPLSRQTSFLSPLPSPATTPPASDPQRRQWPSGKRVLANAASILPDGSGSPRKITRFPLANSQGDDTDENDSETPGLPPPRRASILAPLPSPATFSAPAQRTRWPSGKRVLANAALEVAPEKTIVLADSGDSATPAHDAKSFAESVDSPSPVHVAKSFDATILPANTTRRFDLSTWNQFKLAFERQVVLSIKASAFKRLFFLDLLVVLALACSAGIVFLPGDETKGTELFMTGVQTVYCSIVLSILAATTAVRYLNSDVIVYYKERAAGLSSPAYLLAVFFFYFFATVFNAKLFVLGVESFLHGYHGNFWYAVGATISVWFCFSGLGFVVGALLPKAVALLAGVALPLLLSFMAGVTPAFSTAGEVTRLVMSLSPMRWAVHALGHPLVVSLPGVSESAKRATLDLYGWSEEGTWHAVLFLIAGGVVFHFIASLLMHCRAPRG